MKKKGFTIIELMVAIAIIALIAAITIPRFTNITNNAKVANVQENLANIRTSIAMYYVEHSSFPSYTSESTSLDYDVSINGNLSEAFSRYYSKKELASTPEASNLGISIKKSNKVLRKRDNSGGWVYEESSGKIYANLPNGIYTLDTINEIWNEDEATHSKLDLEYEGSLVNKEHNKKINEISIKDQISSSKPIVKPIPVYKDPMADKEYKKGIGDLLWHVDFPESNGYYNLSKHGIVEENKWGENNPVNLDIGSRPIKTVVIMTGKELEDLDAGGENKWRLISGSKYEYYIENNIKEKLSPKVDLVEGDAITGLKYK